MFTLILVLFYSTPDSQPIRNAFESHVRFLSSDELEGRETSFHGQKIAARYLETQFKLNGALPAFAEGYIQSYPVWVHGLDEEETVLIADKGRTRLTLDEDFMLYARFTAEGQFEGPIAYVGQHTEYSLGVNGRWAMIVDSGSNDGPTIRDRVLKLRDQGALGAMIVPLTEGQSFSAGSPAFRQMSLSPNPFDVRFTFPTVRLTLQACEQLIGNQAAKHAGQPFYVRGVRARLQVKKRSFEKTGDNVAALIRGSDLQEETIIVSAHYDHLGMMGRHIFNGADDNASGTATLLVLADQLARSAPRRNLILLAVSGEEVGLLGSSYFLEHPPVALEKIVANINIDMIGRNDGNTIGVIPAFEDVSTLTLRTRELASQLGIHLQQDLDRFHRRSDHYNFVKSGIPAVFFFSDLHDDYHGEDDHWDRINFDKLARVYTLIEALVVDSLNRDEPPHFVNEKDTVNP
ncbi:MAG: M28 family peptidase [Acidobacteria bacterium]|nr:M28 family peptidase [Acidobacteriota bacterium]